MLALRDAVLEELILVRDALLRRPHLAPRRVGGWEGRVGGGTDGRRTSEEGGGGRRLGVRIQGWGGRGEEAGEASRYGDGRGKGSPQTTSAVL